MGDIITSALYYITNASQLVGEGLGTLGLTGTNRSTVLLIIFAAFIIFVAGFTLGRSRLILSTLCVFVAFFVERNTPLRITNYQIHLAEFVLLYIISFFIFNRSVLKHRVTLKDASIFSILMLSLVNVGLLASVIFSYYPTSSFMGTKTAQLFWAAMTLVAIFFLKGKKESKPVRKI